MTKVDALGSVVFWEDRSGGRGCSPGLLDAALETVCVEKFVDRGGCIDIHWEIVDRSRRRNCRIEQRQHSWSLQGRDYWLA